MKQKEDITELLKQIRSGKQGRDAVIAKLYYDDTLISRVRSTLGKYGGRPSDFDDVYNRTLLQFVKTVVQKPDFEINTDLYSYLSGVAKYVWFGILRKKGNKIHDDIDEHRDIAGVGNPESLLIDESKKELIQSLLDKLGKNCREVLMYWANGYSMKEIAQMMEYKSDIMARKKKHLCFKQLLKLLEEYPELKELLR